MSKDKIQIHEIRQMQRKLSASVMGLIKQTRKEKHMGLKDSYEFLQSEYFKKYSTRLPWD